MHPTRTAVLLAAVTTLPLAAHATEITSVAQTQDFGRVVFDFGDLASKSGQTLGQDNQPYATDGVTFADLVVETPATPLAGSGGVALRSSGIAVGSANIVTIEFDTPRTAVAMQYADAKASSIVFTAFDASGAQLETFTRGGGAGYGGFDAGSAKIKRVSLSAPHASQADAESSRLFVDDVMVTLDDKATGGSSGGFCSSAGLVWTGVLGLAALLRRRRRA